MDHELLWCQLSVISCLASLLTPKFISSVPPFSSVCYSWLQGRPIVLDWDRKRFLYISSAIPTPCGRHSAQVLIDGELYVCDEFTVNIYMFEVPIYIKDSNEDIFQSLNPSLVQHRASGHGDIYTPVKLWPSRDSGIQDMNSDGRNCKTNGNAIEKNFACVDEILDAMGSPVSFDKDVSISLNRSQSLGSSLNKVSDQRTSTPIHRSFEKIVVMMPENYDCDLGKKKYFKKSIEIERNLERSFTTIQKSVAVVKNDREICRGSERITEFGPEFVDLESVSNILTLELKDEESQTGEDLEDLKEINEAGKEDELNEEDFEKELSEEIIELPDEEESCQKEPESDLVEKYGSEATGNEIFENFSDFDVPTDVVRDDFEGVGIVLQKADEPEIPFDAKATSVDDNLNLPSLMADKSSVEIDEISSDGSKRSLQSIQDRISAHEEHVKQLEDQITVLDESRENLQNENEKLLEKKFLIANQLGKDQIVLAREVDDLKNQVEQQEKANNALEWEVQELRSRLDNNDPGEVVQLLEEMKVLRDELITITSKNKDLYGEIVELREENSTLRKQRLHESTKYRNNLGENGEKYINKDESSSSGTEYPEFPVEMLGKNSRSLGIQTCVTALEQEKKKRKTKRKVQKHKKRDYKSDSYSSGSSTDFLLEKADDVIRKSMEELLTVDGDDCKKQRKVIKFGHSSVNIKRPTADVSISCRSFINYPSPFIPKSVFDLNHGLLVKFIHPLTNTASQGIVQSISNDKVDCIQVRLNDSFKDNEINENSSFCEDNQVLSVPLRKIILAWR